MSTNIICFFEEWMSFLTWCKSNAVIEGEIGECGDNENGELECAKWYILKDFCWSEDYWNSNNF